MLVEEQCENKLIVDWKGRRKEVVSEASKSNHENHSNLLIHLAELTSLWNLVNEWQCMAWHGKQVAHEVMLVQLNPTGACWRCQDREESGFKGQGLATVISSSGVNLQCSLATRGWDELSSTIS